MTTKKMTDVRGSILFRVIYISFVFCLSLVLFVLSVCLFCAFTVDGCSDFFLFYSSLKRFEDDYCYYFSVIVIFKEDEEEEDVLVF